MREAGFFVQRELKCKQLNKQKEDQKRAVIMARKHYLHLNETIRLKGALLNANIALQDVLRESSHIRTIFEKINVRIDFDKGVKGEGINRSGSLFGCDGYRIYLDNKLNVIMVSLPGSGEDLREGVYIQDVRGAYRHGTYSWPEWALESYTKATDDLESLTKEEIVRRILIVYDKYISWFN